MLSESVASNGMVHESCVHWTRVFALLVHLLGGGCREAALFSSLEKQGCLAEFGVEQHANIPALRGGSSAGEGRLNATAAQLELGPGPLAIHGGPGLEKRKAARSSGIPGSSST